MDKYFRYSVDVFPVTAIVLGLSLSLAPIFFELAPHFYPLFFFGVLLRTLVPIHQHYHSHLSTFRSPYLNHLYDLILSLAGGNTTSLWKVHHGLGHHRDYLDQHRDLEGNLRFGEHIPCRRIVFTILGDALSFWDSLAFVQKLPAAQRHPLLRKIFLEKLLYVSALLVLFWINWKATLFWIALPNVFLGWIIFWFSYAQHDGVPMEDVYSSSTTNFKNNFLFLNVGLHTAHHERPGLHWSKLPERTEEILSRIPPSCIRR